MGQIHSMKHIGIYVKNLGEMVRFYEELGFIKVMQYQDSGNHLEGLLNKKKATILICKLVTPYGKETGKGDMLELIEFQQEKTLEKKELFCIGVSHLALEVDDVYDMCERISANGGTVLFSPIKVMESGNFMAFCKDPEGNYLELVQKGVD